jgi:diacylglycerol kinase family enzyme
VLAAVAAALAVPGDLARVIVAPALTLGVVAAAWSAVIRRGLARALFAALAVLGVGALVAIVLTSEGHGSWLLVVVGLVTLSVALSRRALRPVAAIARSPHVTSSVGPARRGVVIVNPWSGDGAADRVHLAEEARRRGIAPVVLRSGDDLLALARAEVAAGADVIGMAGGDGSQALVATVAMEADVAFVCVPAGTRNHFALDLGLDRVDVVGSLAAFGPAVERRVDVGTVGDRVFVNNVSLGVYAKVVQSHEYRDAKRETTSKMLPELLGPGAEQLELRFLGPRGREHRRAHVVLVSNNPYTLTALGGFGTRARLDTGELGIATAEIRGSADAAAFVAAEAAGRPQRFRGYREWSAPTFAVESELPVDAGVDGEATVLAPPLAFRSLPGALRVRVPIGAPGYSPAALRAPSARWSIATLVRTVLGRAP